MKIAITTAQFVHGRHGCIVTVGHLQNDGFNKANEESFQSQKVIKTILYE